MSNEQEVTAVGRFLNRPVS